MASSDGSLYWLALVPLFYLLGQSVQFSPSVLSNSLWPHESQHARPPCPSPTPGVYLNSCPGSGRSTGENKKNKKTKNTHVHWVDDAIQSSHPLSSPFPPTFNLSQHQGLFKWASSSHQVIKYWSFSSSISPSNKHSGLISFRMDWLALLAVQGTLKSLLPTPQFKSMNSLALNFLHSPTLISIHDFWKNHSFD